MTRLSLDQGLAPKAAAVLRQYGFDAIHVSEIGMEKSDDLRILDRSRSDDRVCVTLDHDFHAYIAKRGTDVPRRFCCVFRVLMCVQCAKALSDGAAVSADQTSIRVHRLPLK